MAKETPKGKIEVYYEDNNLIAIVKGMQIGSETIDVNLEYSYSTQPEIGKTPEMRMSINYQNINWYIYRICGHTTMRVNPRIAIDTQEARDALEWEIANGLGRFKLYTKESPPSKAACIRDIEALEISENIYVRLEQFPLFFEKLKGFDSYLSKRDEEIDKRNKRRYEQNLKAGREKRSEIDRKFKGKPDPFNSLVDLIESNKLIFSE